MTGRLVTVPFDAPTHVFVVLRLTVDQQGQLMYGEVVDGGARSWGHFNNWFDAIRGVRSYLANLSQGGGVNHG